MSVTSFLDGKVVLHAGDCRDVLPILEAESINSVVCDPPYHLTSIVKRFGKSNLERDDSNLQLPNSRGGTVSPYKRVASGFMGKQWDGGDVAFRVETWAAILRVLKPGGHLVAFSGTRTYHRMVCAIEDAGFEVRDQIAWTFGSGFPKSHNAGNGWGTALKPAWEPIVLARKPLIGTVVANVLKHGTGALNIDGCRIDADEDTARPSGVNAGIYGADNRQGMIRGGSDLGRWPANLVHDGSPEVLAGFPDVHGAGSACDAKWDGNKRSVYGKYEGGLHGSRLGDSGSAARFFYTAKADSDDRIGSKHPTVKPVDLMQWLVRLVTPTGGLVLDPFAGTGTTGEAAFREGMRAILIEREAEYQADIGRRMKLCVSGIDERKRESLKASGKIDLDAGPLFAGAMS